MGSRTTKAFKRGLIWLHKWLGVALALCFAMWFASGIVLHFVPFPTLSDPERLAALPALVAPPGCCLDLAEASRRAQLQTRQARLGMLGTQPVWRVLAPPAGTADGPAVWQVLNAHDGTRVPSLDATQAMRLAEAFSGRHATAVEPLERDQWTVPQGLNAYRPLFKVSLGAGPEGDDGLQLYVSPGAAEVVRDTRRAERFWNWLGAVPHWLYPTVLRQLPQLWHHVVVWLSIPGVIAAATGLALGVWQLFLNRSRWIPYRQFWMRWHHLLGLLAGVFTLTWMFSGLLSMNPFDVFGGRAPDAQEHQRWQGPPVPVSLSVAQALAASQQPGWHAVELELLRIGGQAWYRLRDAEQVRWVRAGPLPLTPPATVTRLPDPLIVNTLSGLRQHPPPRLTLLTAYDDLYYSRHPQALETHWQRPLPVWQATWSDGVRVYADPASGRIVLRSDPARQWERVLYQGLHSLDFAPLLARPMLRRTLIIGLSILGLAMSLTACLLAWRVLAPRRASRSTAARGRRLH